VYNGLPPMKLIPEICQAVSTALFAGYGLSCFFSSRMIAEFDRYRLRGQRVLTGVLQIAGAVGLVVGHFNRPILLLSSGGLALMMFLAVVTRFRIRDPLYAAIPAFSLFVLNAYIFAAGL
jgi:hypothetical protein